MLGWELPPHHTGGMGVVCYQMCKELASSGVDIDFILPYTADFDIDFMKVVHSSSLSYDEIKNAGGVYDFASMQDIYLDESSPASLDMRNQQIRFVGEVAALTKYAEFDIIHAHDWLTFRAAMAVKAQTGKPLIAHVHSTQYDQSGGGYGNPVIREIEYTCFMMADQIFAISEYCKNVLINEYGVSPSKISVVHNSMEVATEVAEDHNLHRYLEIMKSRGYRVVVNCGRMTRQKGLVHLLQAAREVIAKDPKVLFLLAGGGDQQDELMEIAADFGIAENVIFTGWLNGAGKAWRDSFKIGDVFVMPSVSEPFGIAALEAIGYGVPIIISKQSGVGEMIQNALKVDFWDINQMANMILSVVQNPGLRSSLRSNSYQEYCQLSWRAPASKMVDYYNKFLPSPTEALA